MVRRAAPQLVPALAAAAIVAELARERGGYYSTSWGWPALVLGTVLVGGVLLRERFELGLLDAWLLGGLVGFSAWIALSALWSWSVPSTLLRLWPTGSRAQNPPPAWS